MAVQHCMPLKQQDSLRVCDGLGALPIKPQATYFHQSTPVRTYPHQIPPDAEAPPPQALLNEQVPDEIADNYGMHRRTPVSEPTTKSRFPLVALPAKDRLKHFAKDRPEVRLCALFIE